MELSFKRDVIREIQTSEGGRILLHDEVEQDGSFEIVPVSGLRLSLVRLRAYCSLSPFSSDLGNGR